MSTAPEGKEALPEALAASLGSLEAHFVTPEQWSTLKAGQFAEYQALVIGTGGCGDGGERELRAASDNREVWSPLIDGNVFLTTAAPSDSASGQLEQDLVFASQPRGKTGLYLALGCAHESAVTLLEPFGAFTLESLGCRAGEPCEVFTQYPDRSFSPGALAWDSRGRSAPYTLMRQAGEDSAPVAGSPPVARCKNVVITATDTCGFTVNIDAGSSDPDGDLVGCTQSPAGPYGAGMTSITLTCMDATNQLGSCTGSVNVLDANKPVLSLIGPPQIGVECGETIVDPGVSAYDLCEGDISRRVPIPNLGSPPPGSYTVVYGVQDSAGNRADPVARTFSVRDTRTPTLTVLGPSQSTYECGSTYVDPGATAQDLCFGDLTDHIIVTMTGDPNSPGSFYLSYSVTDPAGNTATSHARQVTAVDTVPPVLVLNGDEFMTAECQLPTPEFPVPPFSDPGASATDACAGDVTPSIVRMGEVNQQMPGLYTLAYDVSDPSGNSAPTLMRTVEVLDTLPPMVTIQGSVNPVHECGSGPFPYPRASVRDVCEGYLPFNGGIDGTVDPGQPGSYLVQYLVSDSSGNVGIGRLVATVQDTLPPQVGLIGPATQTVECGTPYTDPGATAADLCAGDVTASIVRSGSVNTGTVGRYTLGYSAADPRGNRSAEVPRTVNVTDTMAPTLKLLGPTSQTISAGTPYSDPGATAADRCPGTVTVSVSGSVNTSVPGTYVLRYSAKDRSGNTSQPLTRTVTVSGYAESLTARTAEQ